MQWRDAQVKETAQLRASLAAAHVEVQALREALAKADAAAEEATQRGAIERTAHAATSAKLAALNTASAAARMREVPKTGLNEKETTAMQATIARLQAENRALRAKADRLAAQERELLKLANGSVSLRDDTATELASAWEALRAEQSRATQLRQDNQALREALEDGKSKTSETTHELSAKLQASEELVTKLKTGVSCRCGKASPIQPRVRSVPTQTGGADPIRGLASSTRCGPMATSMPQLPLGAPAVSLPRTPRFSARDLPFRIVPVSGPPSPPPEAASAGSSVGFEPPLRRSASEMLASTWPARPMAFACRVTGSDHPACVRAQSEVRPASSSPRMETRPLLRASVSLESLRHGSPVPAMLPGPPGSRRVSSPGPPSPLLPSRPPAVSMPHAGRGWATTPAIAPSRSSLRWSASMQGPARPSMPPITWAPGMPASPFPGKGSPRLAGAPDPRPPWLD